MRYLVQLEFASGGWILREVEFDGVDVTRAWHDGEPVELAAGFSRAITAVLQVHEESGHAGKPMAMSITPVPA